MSPLLAGDDAHFRVWVARRLWWESRLGALEGAYMAGAPLGLAQAEVQCSELLRARGVCKSFGAHPVLTDVDLTVAAGEAIALVGENGAGKSTLLRICAGLVAPNAGRVEREGRVGYCPQQPGVFDRLTADEHLVVFGRGLGLGRTASIEAGRRVLAELHFPVGNQSLAGQLSGGTRQKLNLGLALLGDPPLLLLDEPYQGFDHGTYLDFWSFVDTWREQGRGVVVVTHMLAELDRVDRVVELTAQHETAAA